MEHTELASLGGKARAKKLSAKRRKEIARNAGKAGGRGRKEKQGGGMISVGRKKTSRNGGNA